MADVCSLVATGAIWLALGAGPPDHLELQRVFQITAEHNLSIQIARAEQVAAMADVRLAEGRFATLVQTGLEVNQRLVASTDQGSQWRYELGLSRSFASGTTLSLGNVGSHVWSRSAAVQNILSSTISPSNTDPFYYADPAFAGVSLSVQQALLRGAGFTVNEAPTVAAQELHRAAKIAVDERISQQLRDVEIEYWGWAQAVRAVEIRKTSLQLAIAQKTRTEQLIRAGRQARSDSLLAQQIVAERRDALAVAENEAHLRYERLYVRMGYQLAEIPTTLQRPQKFPAIQATLDDLESVLAATEKSAYLLRRLSRQRRALEEQVRAADDASLPSLTATAAVDFYGTDEGVTNALNGLGANRVWRGGLLFSYPFGPNPEAARAARTRATLRQQLIVIEQARRRLQLEISAAHREVGLARSRIELAQLARQLATQKLEAEEERYAIGRTTMQNLRLFQEDLDQAALREVQATVAYVAARAQLDHLTGQYLQRRGLAERRTSNVE